MRSIHGTAAALALAGALIAAGAQAQNADEGATPGGTSGAPASGAQTGDQTSKTLSSSDQAFFDRAYQDAIENAALGRLAQTQGSKAEIKKLGDGMVDDATAQLTTLRNFAQKNNATLPSGLTAAQQDEVGRLTKEKGAHFDKAFLSHVQKLQRSQMEDMERQSLEGTNPDLKSMASNEVKVLKAEINDQNATGVTAPQAPNKQPAHKQPPMQQPAPTEREHR